MDRKGAELARDAECLEPLQENGPGESPARFQIFNFQTTIPFLGGLSSDQMNMASSCVALSLICACLPIGRRTPAGTSVGGVAVLCRLELALAFG